MIDTDDNEKKQACDENFLKLKKTIEEIKLVLRCGICYSTINDGILTTCNHAFCKKCHAQCFQTLKNLRCPICNQIVNKRSCQPCLSLSIVTKQYLNLARCFKADCAALSVPKEMQFLESQAICDSQFKPFDNVLPSTSAAAPPVFLIPQLAPRAKRPRMSKCLGLNRVVKSGFINKRAPVKVSPFLETIKEVAETPCGSSQKSSGGKPKQDKSFYDAASQCETFNSADELKKVANRIISEGKTTPVEALLQCLPWISEFIGLAGADICDALHQRKKAKENMISFECKATQTLEETLVAVNDPVSTNTSMREDANYFLGPLLNSSRTSRRRDSFIDVVGVSDRDGKEDMDSDATVPMYIDERSRLSDIDHVEQSNKENNGPLKVEEIKGEANTKASPKQDFFLEDENTKNGFGNMCCSVNLVEEVVDDSLDGMPITTKSSCLQEAEKEEEKSGTVSGASVVYKYKLMVSGGIQSSYLFVLQKFFETFRAATIWEDFDDECSHLVILNSEGRLCTKRSVKYAWAIAKSIPVLCRKWLEDSLAEKKLLPIEDYEIIGDLYCDPESNSSLRSRTNPGSLFSGLSLCFPSAYFKDSDIERDLLIKMAEAAGGNCTQDIWDVHYPKDIQKCYIIFGVGCRNREAAKRFEEDLKINVLVAEWILDCLTQFVLFDTRVYRIVEH